MPSNQINPFNYDIDNFDSGFLGPITDTNFRTFLFTHNLNVVNPVIGGVLGGNPWADRGTEYNVSNSIPKVNDVPNLMDVANTPSLFNNMSDPRNVNLSRNIQGVNPQVAALGITNSDLGVDATTQFNPTVSNLDLPSVEDVAITAGPLNNFTTPQDDNLAKNPTLVELSTWYPNYIPVFNQYANAKQTSYGVPTTLKLGYAGSVESWVNDGGYTTTTHEIRDIKYFHDSNVWGPASIIQYNTSDALLNQDGAVVVSNDTTLFDNTGFKQYNTNVQGDFRDQLFSRTLGVGIIPFSTLGSGINYKPDGTNISDLDTIARKRRGIELANRIKLNFTDDVVGSINTSIFDLAAGGSLVRKNYQITVPKTGLGKAAQFIATLGGFELPTSIIPSDAFATANPMVPSGTEIDISNQLLDYTGAGQKSLLFSALDINKYGPTLGDAYNPAPDGAQVKKSLIGAGQPPQTYNYLSDPKPNTTRQTTVLDDINNKISSVLHGAQNTPQIPTEFDNPTIELDQNGGFYGKYEPFEAVGRSFSEKNGFGNQEGLFEATDHNKPITTYNGTATEQFTTTDQTGTVNEKIDWRKRTANPYKKGILKYTQDLVNKSKLGDAAGYIGYFDSAQSLGTTEYKQDIDKHGHLTGVNSPTSKPTLPSKGNTTRNYEFSKDGPASDKGGEFYCRSWSSSRKYHTWDNLVRSGPNWWRVEKDWSNLMTMNHGSDPTGIPKIAWDSYDNEQESKGLKQAIDTKTGIHGRVIPYMFSIENLAWKDSPQYQELPNCEKGPNGGRIMWFPPYNIDFSDNESASWDATNFIGRGEAIYTYNHTERSGTLSWSIVVDHPSVLNELKSRFKETILDEGYNSFFAGCSGESIKEIFSDVLPSNAIIKEELKEVTVDPTPLTPKKPSGAPDPLKIYFENCRSTEAPYTVPKGIGRDIDASYEITMTSIAGQYGGSLISECSSYNGLNVGMPQKLSDMAKFLATTEDGKNYQIVIEGHTSSANPNSNFNTTLAQNRADNTKNALLALMKDFEKTVKVSSTNKDYPSEESLKNDPNRWKVLAKPDNSGGVSKCTRLCDTPGTNEKECCDGDPCDGTLEPGQANSRTAKEARYSIITLVENTVTQANLLKQAKNDEIGVAKAEAIKEQAARQAAAELAAKYYINECDYFMELKKSDPFVYSSLSEKLKGFHPAFHAITPEGFNSRLTFLRQCTRQGPQMLDDNQPQNMVFGRPPVCVLKIGDFYHTKIIPESINFSFDPLQWDLNPEGIGVQPMTVKVDMSFKFIGGSSLGGPIKQLQNAVSYNFFANTGVYRPAQVLENVVNNRRKFIYGGFITPEEANAKWADVSSTNQNISNTEAAAQASQNATSNDTSKAASTPSDTAKVEATQTEANKTNGSTTTGTEGSTKVPTPANTTPSKGGIMTYNQDGSVNVSDINTTFQKDNLDYRPSITIMNKTNSPIVVQNVNESSNIRGMAPILPNETSTFNLVPELDPDITYNRSVKVTTNRGEHQIKVFLKPQ